MGNTARLCFVVCIGLLLICSAGMAGTLNVPGSYGSIQAAVTAAVAGDTIQVSGGPYTENVAINDAGHSRSGLTIQGSGVTINGGFYIAASGSPSTANVTIDGFTIVGGFPSGGHRVGVMAASTGHTIKNCIIKNVVGSQANGIETVGGADNLLIDSNEIFGCFRGIFLNPANGITIRGNFIHENNGVGVGIGCDGQSNLTLTNNTISGHSLEGWGMGTVGTGVVAHNNTFTGNLVAVAWYGTNAIDAENNWWGSANGPADATGTVEVPEGGTATPPMCNKLPAGALGDAVGDGGSDTTGFVDYYPWLGSNPNPAGSAVAVTSLAGAVGQTVQLSAKLTSDGNPLPGRSLAFSVAGVAVGNSDTDAAGVASIPYLIAGTPGPRTITVAYAGDATSLPSSGTGTLTVSAAAPTAITLTLEKPAGTPVTSVVSGEAVTCKVLGNNDVDYTSACTYYVQYGAGGSWSTVAPKNIYTAAKAGTWNVTAVHNTLTATKPLTVTAGVAMAVTLTPAAATVNVGDAQAYVVTATDAAGNVSTPAAADITWSEDGAGDIAGYTYTAVAGDAGKAVRITATVGGATSAAATLNVNATAGSGTILAWDKDTKKFYLCSNATNPQAGTEITGSGTYGGIAVTVSGTGTNVTVTAASTSLRVTWYLRSGSLYRAYQYSNGTTAGSKTATFDGTRTLVDGAWKSGFWGLTHTISGGAATYGSAQQ
ncbi:MAG: right-handed parallel beta-helix repeat-containing protein [Armatimonadia bacterium]